MRILLRPNVLLILAENEDQGYELYDQLQNLGFDPECLDTSMLYRDLREMEEMGLITSRWDAEESKGPQRRVYRIDKEGHRNLEEWIAVLDGLSARIKDLQDRDRQYQKSWS